MPSIASRELARAARRIDALAADELPTQRLVERVAEELRTAVPVDALVLAATDPDTLLGLGAGVVHGMPQAACHPFWEYEFEVPDYNKFSDLAHGPRQVADLHAATGGRAPRRPRHRELRPAAAPSQAPAAASCAGCSTRTPSCGRRSPPAAAAGACCTSTAPAARAA